jgi:AAA15 family ATPase/GTPase
MLVRFNIENFLSFGDNQEFSMSPGKVKLQQDHLIEQDGMKLLKFCAVYGANASGKSNFVKAIHCARDLVVRGIDSVNCARDFFRLDKSNKDKSTLFEFEIKLGDACYAYGFRAVLSAKIIESEWLYRIDSKGERMIFERVTAQNSFEHKLENMPAEEQNKLNVYIGDIAGMTNTLFISEMARKKIQPTSPLVVFTEIYEWFDSHIQVVYPNKPVGGLKYFFNEDETSKLANLLGIFDTGITQFKLKEITKDELYSNTSLPAEILDDVCERFAVEKHTKSAILSSPSGIIQFSRQEQGDQATVIKKLFFEHGPDNNDFEFEYHEESDGTRRLLDLLLIILESARTKNKVFVVDELDRSLHPQLSKKFIELFFKVAEGTNTQLITTTHESELMDLSLLRRDEIWFVERGNNYQSRIFSLDEFKERYDKKVSKAYLEGRYGALPIFKSFESYTEAVGDE